MKIANLSDSVFAVYDTDGRTLAYFGNEEDARKFIDQNIKNNNKVFIGKKDEIDGVKCITSQYGQTGSYPPDNINHPQHYNNHPSGIECIQVTEHMNFCLGNAVKYIWRAGLKDTNKEKDLQKAIWYLNREIERVAKFRRVISNE